MNPSSTSSGVGFAGGTGRWSGVFIGVVALGILQAGFVFEGLNSYYQLLAKGALLLIALGTDQIVAARRRRTGLAQAGPTSNAPVDAAAPRVRAEDQAEGGALECAGLAKSYGAVTAVKNVGFTARRARSPACSATTEPVRAH